MSEIKYVGSELELFADVTNWKSYWASQVRPFLKGDILEVGAGLGSNTRFLVTDGGTGRWVGIEPDPDLYRLLVASYQAMPAGHTFQSICGTLDAVAGQRFDTILYIDVLEHIEDDRHEVLRAAEHLRPGGHLVVLSPAHQRLFSPFDAAIGHFRRYNRRMLLQLTPPTLAVAQVRYLDCGGLFLSAGNAALLKQSLPQKSQLQFWDRWVIPVSRVLDKIFRYSLGKTIVIVWKRKSE